MNESKIQILQMARGRIESGMDEYICYSIDHIVLRHREYSADAAAIKLSISKGLHSPPAEVNDTLSGNQITGYTWKVLESWLTVSLSRTDLGLANRLSVHSNYPLMQLCRLAWIDKMIETLTTKGCLP